MTSIAPIASPLAGSPSEAADTSRLATKENLQQAAQKFESLFINQMLKSARSAKLSDGLFDSEALNQFQDMQDTKLAETMAVHTPMGIGRALADFLAQNRPDLKGDGKAGAAK